jgi:hypothetical protein
MDSFTAASSAVNSTVADSSKNSAQLWLNTEPGPKFKASRVAMVMDQSS